MSFRRHWLNWLAGLGVLAVLNAAVVITTSRISMSPLPASASGNGQVAVKYAKRPLIFETNQGQADLRVKYLARGLGYGLLLTADGSVLNLCSRDSTRETGCTTVHVRLLGASRNAAIEGQDRIPGASNYFSRNDTSRWRTGIAQFTKVRYREVYPGIDLVYYGNQHQLEYDFVVAPGADPEAIRLAYSGADRLFLDRRGDLHIQMDEGELIQHKPEVYQTFDEHKKPVEGRFKLTRNGSGARVAFAVGSYDQDRPLIIDPVLSYSTYLGGSNFDHTTAIAVDDDGNAYLAGATISIDFPTANPLQAALAGDFDVFVTKLDGSGRLLYSTYLGGSDFDLARAIAVDDNGDVYVAGDTDSNDFPTANALQADSAGGTDAFVTKLAANGRMLVYSTYLGGNGDDLAAGIALDASDSAYVVGETDSPDFHTTANALQATPPEPEEGCFFARGRNAAEIGRFNAFAVKLDAGGGAPLYATYLGGSNFDTANGVAVNAAGNAYVVGTTCSTNFPTVSPLQPDNAGGDLGEDAFVAKLDTTGSALLYSTYLGGNEEDGAAAVAVGGSDNAYVAGFTNSCDFPTANALQPAIGDCVLGSDGFIAKFDSGGNRLMYSTYLGGTAGDSIAAIAVDASGNAYVAGTTSSTDFPTVNPIQAANADSGELVEVFMAQVDAGGRALVWSTYLGGERFDETPAIAVDGSGNTHVAGNTDSTDFPTVNPGQNANAGSQDAFIAKVAPGSEGGERDEGGGSFGWFLLAVLSMMAARRAVK